MTVAAPGPGEGMTGCTRGAPQHPRSRRAGAASNRECSRTPLSTSNSPIWQARLPRTSTLACRNCCSLQEIFDMARSLQLLPILAQPASLCKSLSLGTFNDSHYPQICTKCHYSTL